MNEMHTPLEPNACVLKDTIAEMTYPEVEASISRGAVALWGLGVIEQHGPHLPTGTDIYVPSARLRLVRRYLANRRVESLIIPPFYWGVNHVSASFPTSYRVRPEIMVELMRDVIASLAQDGLGYVFCVSGHGDADHNKTILRGLTEASSIRGINALFTAPAALFQRIGINQEHPNTLPIETENSINSPRSKKIDVHAGTEETSIMIAAQPSHVRMPLLGGLPSTGELPAEDLAKWRTGYDAARSITPDGYFGDPASATAALGIETLHKEATDIANTIIKKLNN